MNNTSDYQIFDYPFGMLQPGRYWERGWYDSLGHRYGFNGMERDDDIMESRTNVSNARRGAGNSYTTQFRQFDPRTGRWWSRDPVFQEWQSTYTGLDNNPILFTDTKGNIVTETLDKWIIQTVNAGYDSKYEKLRKKYITVANGDCQHILDEMDRIALEKTIFNMKMNQLRKSPVVYDLGTLWNKDNLPHLKDGVLGRVYNDAGVMMMDAVHADAVPKTGNADVYYQSAIFRHELEHLWQYDSGMLSFRKDGVKPGSLYDIRDEQEAMHTMHIFGVNTNIKTIEDIYSNFYGAYKHLEGKHSETFSDPNRNISIFNMGEMLYPNENLFLMNTRHLKYQGQIVNDVIEDITIGELSFSYPGDNIEAFDKPSAPEIGE